MSTGDLIIPGAHIIGYTDTKGAINVRSVEVLKADTTGFFAHCHLRNSARRFLFARIIPHSVYAIPTPAPSTNAAAIIARMGRTLTTLMHTAALDAPDAALLIDAIDDARSAYRAAATA
jgi:hypothetical protein